VKPTESEKAATKSAAAKAADDVMAMLSDADTGAGKKAFKKCKACHSTEKGGKNRVGPNLWDIVGKAKATGDGFKYSDALKGLGGEWSYPDLNAFLISPKAFAKGTKMSFRGLSKAKDRAAVIAYLRSLSDQPKPLP
jgi:cytochrome c